MTLQHFFVPTRQPMTWSNLHILAALLALTLPASAGEVRDIRFNRDIRPILAENCFRCHGPELKSRKAKLRLDVREVAVAKGAIVPGKPDASELIKRLDSTDPEEHMPPPATHKIVTPAQMNLLRRWIADGAEYEPHWSYAPVKRPALPQVSDSKRVRNAIDAFILARLEESKLTPSPPADRRTLLRRLSLDLTGLPPTPAEVEQFVKDRSPTAYAKQVERLLASPHFGERMAVPWLDAVRFADTVGYHGDQNQNIFPYRDYVIESFNRNKPFDQFTIEQLAGDLLPNATEEQKIATGFNRLNMMTREGGAQPKEYLAKYAADRVRTVSTAWLGSTMACAECHDHKYDPFTQRDFYSLAAFFDDVKQWGVYQDYGYTPNPELAGWSNDHPFPPELFVTNQYLLRREARLNAEVGRLGDSEMAKATASTLGRASFRSWQAGIRDLLKTSPDGWWIDRQPIVKLVNTNSPTTVTVQPDGSVLCSGNKVKADKFQVLLALEAGWVSAIRLELLPHPAHSHSSLRFEKGGTEIKLAAEVKRSDGHSTKLPFYHADATSKRPVYENGYELLDVRRVWKLDAQSATNQQSAVYLLDPPLAVAAGDALQVTIESDALGCFLIATSPLANPSALLSGATPEFIQTLERPPGRRTRNQKQLLGSAWLHGTTNNLTVFAQLKDLSREILECRHGITPTLVTVATTNPLITRVLPRGNWQDESGAIVAPAVPHFLPQPPPAGTNQLTRLDLARWLVARENPLTARAFVNRVWKQFFGNGLSNRPEELGAQGEPPSHPELLDWLASEFMDSGWDVKHVARLMVSSAAYQQDATIRPELRDTDPNNRLLARQNPRRLEAEFVRDNALCIAGLLNSDIGGPSVFPYQPADYYANIQFPNRDYLASPDARQYRRGVYSHWQRTFLHPMLANFDAPAREECSVDRPVSTTPQQALTLLNDPSFVEAARVFAAKLLRTPNVKGDAARVNLAIETALLRPAKTPETASLVNFLAGQRDFYAANEADAQKLVRVGRSTPATGLPLAEYAAWTSLARVVLNLHETITRY
jgi:hypothetical protein